MLRKIIAYLVIALFLVPVFDVYADYTEVKTVGSIKSSRKNSVSSSKRRKALADAKHKALDKYIASLDSQRVRILNEVKDKLHDKIDTYVIEVRALNDGYWDSGFWVIDVQATINEAQIEEIVRKRVGKTLARKQTDDYLSFIFVARESDEVVKYKDTVEESGLYKDRHHEDEQGEVRANAAASNSIQDTVDMKMRAVRTGVEPSATSAEVVGKGTQVTTSSAQSSISGDYVSSRARAREYEYSTKEAGSATKKSDAITYKGYISEDIDNKVTEIFNKADFAVIPSFEASVNVDSFVLDFVKNDTLSDKTKQSAIQAAKSKGIKYLAVGTLDVDEQLVDQATGLQKAYVRVNAFVWDLNGKFVRKICSVGPVQYSGVGESPRVAKTNALINAGTAAAKDLVDQLRVKHGL